MSANRVAQLARVDLVCACDTVSTRCYELSSGGKSQVERRVLWAEVDAGFGASRERERDKPSPIFSNRSYFSSDMVPGAADRRAWSRSESESRVERSRATRANSRRINQLLSRRRARGNSKTSHLPSFVGSFKYLTTRNSMLCRASPRSQAGCSGRAEFFRGFGLLVTIDLHRLVVSGQLDSLRRLYS